MKDANATVAVFKGDVEVASASGRVKVEKKHSATFALAGTGNYTLANNLEPDPYDEWDKQLDKYHQQYSVSNSFSPYGYGASDLSYYGSFYNIPGYGMMWQPYLVGAGWDPFMNGAWMWYPGAGYAWVSAYPWGWTPYRYGSWTYLNAYGWFWQPGSTWAGWNTGPRIVNAPQTFSATQAARHAGTDLAGQPYCAGGPGASDPEPGGSSRRLRWTRSGPRQCAQSGKSFSTDGASQLTARYRHACPSGCIRSAHAARRQSRVVLASRQYSNAQRCSGAQLGPDVQSPHERWRRGVGSQPARQSPLAKRGSSKICRT